LATPETNDLLGLTKTLVAVISEYRDCANSKAALIEVVEVTQGIDE